MSGARFNPGDVLSYVPTRDHCREGTAWVNEAGVALDTYWRAYGDGESHVLTRSEINTATIVFNVADFDALDRYLSTSRETWETYAPDDRARITSQHGLQEVLLIRKGAQPDLPTQIANAQREVERAEAEVRSAEHTLERHRQDLAELEPADSDRMARS
jgi:hypothetical protein